MDLHGLIQVMVERGASDLFIPSGRLPFLRIDGQLEPIGSETVSPEDARRVVESLLGDDEKRTLSSSLAVDTSFELHDLGRFRINVFHQGGNLSMAIRRVMEGRLSFAELNLPAEVLIKLATERRGLVLVTGTAGSGKSTTLAAMINYINANQARHIITIEDPVEYVFESDKSLIEQREVGMDTPGFAQAMRDVVRQSPDVIMIGEMRDKDTINAALSACETGHLVLSTLHTTNAAQTIERIVNFFPPYLHKQVRAQIASVIKAILSMRLLKRRTGQGLIPAVEIMLDSPTIRKKIAEGQIEDISDVIAKSRAMGMQTFNQALLDLYKKGLITAEEGSRTSDSMHEFNIAATGVFATEASEIEGQHDKVGVGRDAGADDAKRIPFLE